MGKTRTNAKRELQRSYDSIDWSLTHIKAFLDLGYRDLPDYNLPLEDVIKSMILAQEVLITIKSKI